MTNINEQGAVDLDKHMREREVEKAAQTQAATEAALKQVQEWDRAMQRAFKGIVSRPARHRMISQSIKEADRG